MKTVTKKAFCIILSLCFVMCSSGVAYADEPTTAPSNEMTVEQAQAVLEEQRKALEQSLKESEEKLKQFSESE